MYASEQIKTLEFTGKTVKEAYLSCCKWLSTNVIAVNNSENITYKIEKLGFRKEGTYKVKLTLFITIDQDIVKDKNCEICKEVTGSFFLKQNKHMCESCRLLPYEKRVKDKIEIIKQSLKGKVL